MSRKWARTIFIVGFLALTCIGFRPFPGDHRWAISPTDTKVWVNFESRPSIGTNDLPSGDPLFGQVLSFDSITQSIFDDYNGVTTSFFNLGDVTTDPTYTAAKAVNRTINVYFTSTSFGEGGDASPTITDGQVTGCTIKISSSATNSAKAFVQTLTHELGHCAGLDHPQDTTHAVMSYFTSDLRLQDDDKMGLTYLYPSDPSYGHESPTLGFACTPK